MGVRTSGPSTLGRAVAVLGLLAALVVAIVMLRRHADSAAGDEAAPGQSAEVAGNRQTGEGHGPARPPPGLSPATAGSGGSNARPGIGFAAPGSLATIPDHYELSMDGPHAFVNLAGGPSKQYVGHDHPDLRPAVTVHGRVVDAKGHGVGGAIVVFDRRIGVMAGHLSGDTGTTTDAAGEFSTANAHAGEVAIALDRTGWSDVVEIGAAPLVLHMQGRGAMQGRATYNGHGESFDLLIRPRPEGKLDIRYQTDPGGRYTIASLPPGSYTVVFSLAQVIGGGVSKPIDREVTIVDRETAELDASQTSATVVVVTPVLPDDIAPGIVEFWLFAGDRRPADIDEIRTRAKVEHVPGILYGGKDARTPNQFQDVGPGAYVTCVIVDRTALEGCAPVTVMEGDSVREVEVRVIAPTTPGR